MDRKRSAVTTCLRGHPVPTGSELCDICGDDVRRPRCSQGHHSVPGEQFCETCGELLLTTPGYQLSGAHAPVLDYQTGSFADFLASSAELDQAGPAQPEATGAEPAGAGPALSEPAFPGPAFPGPALPGPRFPGRRFPGLPFPGLPYPSQPYPRQPGPGWRESFSPRFRPWPPTHRPVPPGRRSRPPGRACPSRGGTRTRMCSPACRLTRAPARDRRPTRHAGADAGCW